MALNSLREPVCRNVSESLSGPPFPLQERLNDKKESLLEKELILEEVTALSEKLRNQEKGGKRRWG